MTQQDISNIQFRHPSDARMGVELITIAQLRQRALLAELLRPKRANFYRLMGVVSGATRPVLDFSPLPLDGGHWLLIRPGEVFAYDFAQPWAGWLLVFRPENLHVQRGARNEQLSLLARLQQMNAHWQLDAVQLRQMEYCLKLMHADSALDIDSASRDGLLNLQLTALLTRMSVWQSAAAQGVASAGAQHFQRFRVVLEREFARAHQVQHYAGALGLSDKSLNRACLAASGLSAKACIAQRVVLEAKRLLAYTQVSVQSVAMDLGFDEPTNFVKFFKRETTLTPGQFRALHSHSGG